MDFPKSKELVGHKNYDEWACLLRLKLDSLGLEKYLDNAFDLDSKLIPPKPTVTSERPSPRSL
jgi:hypothetical protein